MHFIQWNLSKLCVIDVLADGQGGEDGVTIELGAVELDDGHALRCVNHAAQHNTLVAKTCGLPARMR